MPATAVLTVEGVAVRFGGVAALSDANLVVREGSVTGLIGPNGAGKTTLFNVISGLQAPDRGTVHLYDTDITKMKPHRRARLGLARTFQRLELFGTLTAGENVQVGLESSVKWWQWRHVKRAFPWVKQGVPDADGVPADEPTGPGSVAVATSDRLLEGVGLGGMAADQASAMPTGLARMVELARALAMAPKVLLLDEPGSGLDDAESETLGRAADARWRGAAWACSSSSTTWNWSCGSATTSTCSTSATSSPRARPRRSGRTRWSRPPTSAPSPRRRHWARPRPATVPTRRRLDRCRRARRTRRR